MSATAGLPQDMGVGYSEKSFAPGSGSPMTSDFVGTGGCQAAAIACALLFRAFNLWQPCAGGTAMLRNYMFWAAAVTVAAIVASTLLYPQLPARVPIHWNAHGQIDGYGNRAWAAFLLPAMMVLLLGIFRALPWLSPRNFDVAAFRSTYEYITLILMLMMGYIHVITLWAALDPSANSGRWLVAGIFIGFALVGNVLDRVKRNFYIGVRTPWTIADDRVWQATHRLARRVMMASGILGFVLVLSTGWMMSAFLVLIGSMLIPVIYSLVYYKQLQARGEL